MAPSQHRVDPARLVFIDETWTKTNMAPLRGWAPRGARLRSKVPRGHWNTMTFTAALRVDRIDAPWLLDGPINSETFLAYVTHVLVPTLSAAGRHCRATRLLHVGRMRQLLQELRIQPDLKSSRSNHVHQLVREENCYLLPVSSVF